MKIQVTFSPGGTPYTYETDLELQVGDEVETPPSYLSPGGSVATVTALESSYAGEVKRVVRRKRYIVWMGDAGQAVGPFRSQAAAEEWCAEHDASEEGRSDWHVSDVADPSEV